MNNTTNNKNDCFMKRKRYGGLSILVVAAAMWSCNDAGNSEQLSPLAEANFMGADLSCTLATVEEGENVVVKMRLTDLGKKSVYVSPTGTAWELPERRLGGI